MEKFLIKFLFIQILVLLNFFCESLNISTAARKNIYSPTKLSDCSCKLDDGKIIDLKALDDPSKPR